MVLISKEDLLKKFDSGALLFQPDIRKIIQEEPEVDAVPVVRCKECMWWDDNYRECGSPNWYPNQVGCVVQPAGMFCGWGERRTDETN